MADKMGGGGEKELAVVVWGVGIYMLSLTILLGPVLQAAGRCAGCSN